MDPTTENVTYMMQYNTWRDIIIESIANIPNWENTTQNGHITTCTRQNTTFNRQKTACLHQLDLYIRYIENCIQQEKSQHTYNDETLQIHQI
jgi:hypothetical protein